MNEIGFTGGNLVKRIGTESDVSLFFECISEFDRDRSIDNIELISVRLYKRYIPSEYNSMALVVMNKIQSSFARKITKDAIDWHSWHIRTRNESSWLDPNRITLDHLFDEYFKSFSRCVEFADFFHAEHGHLEGHYLPLRTIIANVRGIEDDSGRPLAAYDALDGKPFWLAGSKLEA